MLAWGSKVSDLFRSRVTEIAIRVAIDPSWLMACMAFESGHTFSASIHNAAGSGAVGIIQFMPSTAAALGTTTQALAEMTAEGQLDYVEKYFTPWAGRLKSLGDVYGAILWPAMIGKPSDWVVFNKADPNHPKLYLQNAGLDTDKNGQITKAEVCAKVQAQLTLGLSPPNVWNDNA